ncbi:MAG: hypothetical protein KBT06_10225, partial [Prevotellaceae bacterium]|nr:hypothetical protein [Candidatus Colivivens equi]
MNRIKSIIIALLVFASNFIVAQEVKTGEVEGPDAASSVISYLVDELGYYQNLHGWQKLFHYRVGGNNNFLTDKDGRFKVKFDNGTPKCFKYIGWFRYKSTDPNVDEKDFSQIDHKRFISKGVYDSDGICSYEMNWQLEANECLYIGSPNDFKYCYLWNCHGYQRAAKVLNSKDEPRLVFDAVMSGDFEDEFPIEERTYGFFDSINCYAVQRFVDSKASQGGFLSFILDGSKLYLFESAAELDAFLEFDCHSAKEMQSAYTLNGKEYSKKWKTPFVSNWWFMRAIESMARDDEKEFKVAYRFRDMGAFPEAAKNDIKNIEKSCWNTSFGTKAVYSPYGFNN